ncbi:MAG: Xaa-Pro peptidase family protein [Promethearchaeia archaeon]
MEKVETHKKLEHCDALLVTKPENILYLLGFSIESNAAILFSQEDKEEGKILLILNPMEMEQAKEKIEQNEEIKNLITIQEVRSVNAKTLRKIINKQKYSSLAFEEDYVSVQKYRTWKDKFNVDEFCPGSEILSDARLQKTPIEIDRMKRAAEIGDIGFQTIYETIKEGMTEKELAAEAEYAMRKAGSDGTSFDIIVASGAHSAYPHAKTSKKKVKKDEIILVDLGAKYKGYCSDMSRTFFFGNPPEECKELINLVNAGQKYVLKKAKADMEGKKLDKITRTYFKEQKKEWANRFLHSLGHGVGIDIHEKPYLSPISDDILKTNMVCTLEPGLYIKGVGGARTEDQIIIKENKAVPITRSKKIFY